LLLPAIGKKHDEMVRELRNEGNNEVFSLLRRSGLQNFLSDGQMGTLQRFCRSSERRPGATLFRQGEPANALYVLVDGMVELRARPPGRRLYRTVEVAMPSCTCGDESLFDHDRYLTGARMLEGGRMLALSRGAWERLNEAHPEIALGVLKCAGKCLIQTIRRAAILTHSPAEDALRILLQELSADGKGRRGGMVPVHMTHAQLAGLLHLSRETISRMLRELENQGMVELGRGVIRVNVS
jgi:CRP-like cAMP-binding protein